MNKQRGFTVIELLIATVVFSLILMIALAGILQITKMYYKGVNTARTQEVARTVIDDVGEAIRFSGATLILQPPADVVSGVIVPPADDTNFFCLGSKRYTYAIDRQLRSNPTDSKHKRHVLWVDSLGATGCSGPADLTLDNPSASATHPGENGQELLTENMRIARLDILDLALTNPSLVDIEAYRINLSIAYGDDTTQQGGPLSVNAAGERACVGVNATIIGEYCHVAPLSLIVERRLQ